MKISVIIPTRSRAQYLRSSLSTAIRAADHAECEVEIVVSDNASEDDTRTVVESFGDSRIRYVYQNERLSMRENYERALNHSTGSHVVFIGDDDAVMPHGLAYLGAQIAKTDAEIINWRIIDLHYYWPDDSQNAPGYLALKPMTLSGRRRFIDPAKVLDRFCRCEVQNYKAGGMIYHGCIARTLIERARARNKGPYFWCNGPDVFASMQNLILTETPILFLDMPVTLGGASPKSTGAGIQKYKRTGTLEKGTVFYDFVSEYQGDAYLGFLPVEVFSVQLMILDSLLTAQRLTGTRFEIDKARWKRAIETDIGAIAPELRQDYEIYTRRLLGDDIHLSPPQANEAPAKPERPRTPDHSKMVIKNKLFKSRCIGGPEMRDCQAGVDFLDRLIGMDRIGTHGDTPLHQLARLAHIYKHLLFGPGDRIRSQAQ